ncbi:hypothetical protein ABZ897_30545 [Nonomuraea sp. NPDC046802]|uniref:hypothetical protein n=1 Tax=Nonomuraea sp. NPDC046802 TaxID=3154919 RepID=UPI00340053C5
MRPIASAVIVMALAATGCASVGTYPSNSVPPNPGANANATAQGRLYLRNLFLLNGSDPVSPSPQLALYGVLVNGGQKPDQLERITIEGGGTAQLPGPVALAPNQPVGTGERPLSMVSGVRGTVVPMTFTFRYAGPVRLYVPVKLRVGEFAHLPEPGGAPSPPRPTGTSGPSPIRTRTAPPSPAPTGIDMVPHGE